MKCFRCDNETESREKVTKIGTTITIVDLHCTVCCKIKDDYELSVYKNYKLIDIKVLKQMTHDEAASFAHNYSLYYSLSLMSSKTKLT